MRKLSVVLCSIGLAAAAVAAPTASAAPRGGEVPGLVGAQARAAAGPAADKFLELRRKRTAERPPATSAAAQKHTFWGPEPQLNSGADGLVVTQSVTPSLRLSNTSDVVYAPTMKPTGHSCVEVVTAYGLGQAAQVWAWDWCRSVSPAKVVTINSSFLANYTTTVDGHPAYTVQEVRTNASANTWTASLYNVKTKAWDALFTQSGSDQSTLDEGWDIFEIYATHNNATGNAYYCSDARGAVFQSSSIKLRVGGQWVDATATNSPLKPTTNPRPSDYDCSTLKFELLSPNTNWRVTV
ncbi:carbohydrate-binding protein [Actinosynnema sp. NPDC020468]|uniref:carbohydrate-binding protein n=1 Tax=Actinosynnema sp. NPDC020468 TaxID=3154488 RepID=UPI003401E03A